MRFYDTEDDGTENQNSLAFHLAGGVTEDGVTFEFCIKTKDVGVRRYSTLSSWIMLPFIICFSNC